MNLQLFGYDDGYYYGLAKVVALGTSSSDDGKTVTITNGTKTWTGTMADQKCEFTVPGKDRYTLRMGSFSTTVDISYGECAEVYMADGYGYVRESALSGLTFAQDDNGEWGYKIGGAGSVIPFKQNKSVLKQDRASSYVNSNYCTYTASGNTYTIKFNKSFSGIFMYNESVHLHCTQTISGTVNLTQIYPSTTYSDAMYTMNVTSGSSIKFTADDIIYVNFLIIV